MELVDLSYLIRPLSAQQPLSNMLVHTTAQSSSLHRVVLDVCTDLLKRGEAAQALRHLGLLLKSRFGDDVLPLTLTIDALELEGVGFLALRNPEKSLKSFTAATRTAKLCAADIPQRFLRIDNLYYQAALAAFHAGLWSNVNRLVEAGQQAAVAASHRELYGDLGKISGEAKAGREYEERFQRLKTWHLDSVNPLKLAEEVEQLVLEYDRAPLQSHRLQEKLLLLAAVVSFQRMQVTKESPALDRTADYSSRLLALTAEPSLRLFSYLLKNYVALKNGEVEALDLAPYQEHPTRLTENLDEYIMDIRGLLWETAALLNARGMHHPLRGILHWLNSIETQVYGMASHENAAALLNLSDTNFAGAEYDPASRNAESALHAFDRPADRKSTLGVGLAAYRCAVHDHARLVRLPRFLDELRLLWGDTVAPAAALPVCRRYGFGHAWSMINDYFERTTHQPRAAYRGDPAGLELRFDPINLASILSATLRESAQLFYQQSALALVDTSGSTSEVRDTIGLNLEKLSEKQEPTFHFNFLELHELPLTCKQRTLC